MTFAVMTVFSSGISMYAMALLLNLILGWDFNVSVWLSAIIVLLYISLGGLDLGDLQRGACSSSSSSLGLSRSSFSGCATLAAGADCRRAWRSGRQRSITRPAPYPLMEFHGSAGR